MEIQHNRKISILGIIFVLVGIVLLLKEMDVIDITARKLIFGGLFLYGGATVIRSFLLHERRKIFFGSLYFFVGIFFSLKEWGFLYATSMVYLPLFLFIFGLSFIVLFIFDTQQWYLLLPSFIFLGLGALFMLTELGYLYKMDVWRSIFSYWPVLLILIGIMIVLKRRRIS